MSESEKLLEKLLERVRTSAKFSYAANLLDWDLTTKMPNGGAEGRAEISATVRTEGFKLFTSDELGEILKKLAGVEEVDRQKQVLLRRISAAYQRSKAIPPDLFQAFGEASSKSYVVWVKAKEKSDFKLFQPALEEVVRFARQFAELYGYEKNPYDGLLPNYEPGLTTEDLRAIAYNIRKELVPFVRLLAEQPNKPDETLLQGNFSEDLQRQLSLEILKAIGYDFNRGRLDTTPHPFMLAVGPDDIRVATRFVTDNVAAALFATLHEGGHALYWQGTDPLLNWLPYMDMGFSYGIDESQSRMWENIVGRSLPFWKFFYSRLQGIIPRFKSIPLDDFHRAINMAKPSLIRIYADEVTYNLHIMLRFEIEEALLKGELEVNSLPEIWNAKMQEYLGIVPENDAEGVLQDVQWAGGAFGYFPAYMLGNLYAAQLFAAAKQEITSLEDEIAKGNFNILREWLREKVHRFGLIYEAPKLLQEATGKGPTSEPWLSYIREKFSKIYGI